MATVLVVDDDRDICELVRINLQLDGHRVSVAHDGDVALVEVERVRPDLVILDVMMPGKDGFAVLQGIKEGAPELAATPVVMLTARTDDLDRLKGGIEGALHYVTKPFSVVGLRDTVRAVLAGDAEPAARRRVQQESLAELARLETGRAEPVGLPAEAARPHLTRLEPTGGWTPTARREPLVEQMRAAFSTRQNEILEAVLGAPNLPAAASALGISRSYLYASLGRMARKVGSPSGPELLRTLRADWPEEP